MGLSIPEIPSDTIDRQHARHLKPGHDLVQVAEDVPLLIAEDGTQDSYLEDSSKRFRHAGFDRAGARGKLGVTAVLENSRRPNLEIAARKSLGEVVGVVDL